MAIECVNRLAKLGKGLEAVASTLARVPRAKVAQKGHVRARPLSRHVLVRCSTPLLPAKGLRASATFTLFKALAENSADTFQRAVVEITALPLVPVCPAPLPDLTSADSTDKARLPSQPSGRVQRVQKCRVQRVQKETPSIQSIQVIRSTQSTPNPPSRALCNGFRHAARTTGSERGAAPWSALVTTTMRSIYGLEKVGNRAC